MKRVSAILVKCVLVLTTLLPSGNDCFGQRVIAWGSNSSGETDVPPEATNVIAVAAGSYHSLALRSDGTVVSWGRGVPGAPEGTKNVIGIAAGRGFSMALRDDGTILMWGDTSGLDVPAAATNVIAISAKGTHCLALREDGRMVAWGTASHSLPPALSANAYSAVSAGEDFDVAVTYDGQVEIWGWGAPRIVSGWRDFVAVSAAYPFVALRRNGQVVFENYYTRGVSSVASATNAVAIASVNYYDYLRGFYLRDDGQVMSWGTSAQGLTNVPPEATGITAIAAGYHHILAIKSHGGQPKLLSSPQFGTISPAGKALPLGIRAVGDGPESYQWLADGVPIPGATKAFPSIPAVFGNYEVSYQVVVSNAYGVVTSDAAHITVLPVAAWGYNADHQCDVQLQVIDAVAIAAGGAHGLALDQGGGVSAWGRAWKYGNSGRYAENLIVPEQAKPASAIAAYGDRSIALRTDGRVATWGHDTGRNENSVPDSVTNVVAVASGWAHGLALRADGSVVAWGTNEFEQLDIPVSATNVTAIAAGYCHSLALRSDGTVVGWGGANVPPNLTDVVSIAAGWDHSLVLRRDGSIVAWGDNTYGQANVPPEATNIISIKAGWYHNLAMRADGSVIAWGKNVRGVASVPAGLVGVTQIAVGEDFNLALVGYRPPRFAPQVERVSVHAGGILVLNANVTGELPMTLQWYHGAEAIPGATNRTLVVTEVTQSASGGYRLMARNRLGERASSVTQVEFDALPSVVVRPSRQSVFPGSPLCLSVPVSGGAMDYQWQLDGINLVDDGHRSGSKSPTLNVNPTSPADSGSYTLVMSNQYGAVTGLVSKVMVSPVIVWGDNSMGQADVPAAASNAVAIATRGNHVFALKADGRVIGWGDNQNQQNVIPASITNVVAIADGGNHGLALRGDGVVTNWGKLNSMDNFRYPVSYSATNVVAIAAGLTFDMVLRADGTVVTWAAYGGLAGEPPVPPEATNVVAISAGERYAAFALRADGTIIAWDAPGLLMNWNSESNSWDSVSYFLTERVTYFWKPILDTIHNAIAFDNNVDHMVILLADGTVVALGPNGREPVPDTVRNVVAVSAGGNQFMALSEDGSVITWGNPWATEQDQIPAGLSNVTRIGAGAAHAVALQAGPGPVRTNALKLSYGTGQPATLSSGIPGGARCAYQWQFNGTNIAGATSAGLNFDSLRWNNSGSYRLIVRNAFGCVTNAPIVVDVSRPQLKFDLDALKGKVPSLRITNASGVGSVITYVSTNLVDWSPVSTNASSIEAIEVMGVSEGPQRFYKAVEKP